MRSLLFVVLVGCAQAGAPSFGTHPDASSSNIDADLTGQPDAYVRIDAPAGSGSDGGGTGPTSKTLDQNGNDTLAEGTSEACPAASGGGTDTNTYYRVFEPSAFGITTAFDITKVSFQVEDSESNINQTTGTGTNVTVKVGTYNAAPSGTTIATNKMTQLQTASFAIPEVSENNGDPSITVDVPITATIPAGTRLYVEIDSAAVNKAALYMGTNTAGEPGGLSYIMAPNCSTTTPTSMSTVVMTELDLLLTVTGTY